MRMALVVPGGVDRSQEYRVIPALLALISRLSVNNDVQVFALFQEAEAGEWRAAGARVLNIGSKHTVFRAIRAIRAEHKRAPFDLVQSVWSGWSGLIEVEVFSNRYWTMSPETYLPMITKAFLETV